MQDSEHQKSGPDFLRTFKRQLARVAGRTIVDVRKIIYSQRGDMNVIATGVAIGTCLWAAPWILTTLGIVAVAGEALTLSEGEEPAKEESDDPVADTAGA